MTGVPLNVSGSVVLATVAGTVTGTVRLSPDDAKGPPIWRITGVLLQTSRPGTAPIPAAIVYQDTVSPSNAQGLTYDGSFAPGVAVDVTIGRGSALLCVWTGGQAGDVATMTITGTKST